MALAAAQTMPPFCLRTSATFPAALLEAEAAIHRAAELGYEALAFADVASQAAACAASQAALKAGIFVNVGGRLATRQAEFPATTSATLLLDLLVEDATGWRQLLRWQRRTWFPESSSPVLHTAEVLGASRGLYFLLGGAEGQLAALLRDQDFDQLEVLLTEATSDDSLRDRCFIPVPPAYSGDARQVQAQLLALAEHYGLIPVAACDVRVLDPEDQALAALFSHPAEAPRPRTMGDIVPRGGDPLHLLRPEEVAEGWRDCPFVLQAAREVALHCARFRLPEPQRRFPIHNFHRGVDAESFIWNAVFARATERYGDLPTHFKERLDQEFRVLVEAGLANGIVTLARLAEELDDAGVQRGPGCGILTNSLVASLLGLTRLDPLQFDLPFALPPELGDGGAFPLLQLNVPETQEAEAVGALQRLLEGDVQPVGRWETWTFEEALIAVGQQIGRERRWAEHLLTQPSFKSAATRHRAQRQPAPDPSLSLEHPEAAAWLAARLEGHRRELVLHRGHYAFSGGEPALPLRPVTVHGAPAPLPATEWSSEELGALRHGRIAFDHPPLLDLLQEAGAIVRQQGDFNFQPERATADDPGAYKLLRDGHTAGIQPLERPLHRRTLRMGQPGGLPSLIRLLQSDSGAFPLDVPTILLCHLAAGLKARFPEAFFAAALTQATGNPRRTALLLEEAALLGLAVAPLDVNYSGWAWGAERRCLRPGFCCIRGITPAAAEQITGKRRELHFSSLLDLIQRTDRRQLPSADLLRLLYAGALDGWGLPRMELRRQLGHYLPGATPESLPSLAGGDDYAAFGPDPERLLERYGLPDPSNTGGQTAESLFAQEAAHLHWPLRRPNGEAEAAFLAAARVREGRHLALKNRGQIVSLVGVASPTDAAPGVPGAVVADIGGVLLRATGFSAETLSDHKLAGRLFIATGMLEREAFQWRLEVESLRLLEDAHAAAQQPVALELDLSQVADENLKPLLAWLRRLPGPAPIAMTWLPEAAPRVLRKISQARVLPCPLLEYGLARYAGSRAWRWIEATPAPEEEANPIAHARRWGRLVWERVLARG